MIVAWLEEYCDMRIVLTILKGEKAKIKAHAESMGESVNGFINRAIENQIKNDKREKGKKNETY